MLKARVKTDTTTIKLTETYRNGRKIYGQLTSRLFVDSTADRSMFKFNLHRPKNLKFYGKRTNGSCSLAQTLKADPSAKAKEPFLPNKPFKNVTFGIEI